MSGEEDTSMTISKEMDIQGSHFLYMQLSDRSLRTLDYDYKRCIGCGLCVDICPTHALETGPLKEIATGLDAPPVMLDLEKCTFCSMCVNFCPVNALSMEYAGDFPEEDLYPRYSSFIKMNENCLPCSLCAAACPEEAIEVEYTFPKKEELTPFKEGAQGEIEVDTDKCNLCGVCAAFCDAFILLEADPSPDAMMPFEQLLVDEDQCDYCMLCQDLCPEDAIKVRGERSGEAPQLTGNINVNEDKCTLCGWCRAICPYDAVDLKKPFEGEISLIGKNVDRCDPLGCHACFNVCPSHLWYVPESGAKIAMKEDLCTYCGACVNVCPDDVMTVSRSKVNHTDIPESPWACEWKDAIDCLTTNERKHPDLSRVIEVETEPRRKHPDVEFPPVDDKLMEKVAGRMEQARSLLNNPSSRRKLERGLR